MITVAHSTLTRWFVGQRRQQTLPELYVKQNVGVGKDSFVEENVAVSNVDLLALSWDNAKCALDHEYVRIVLGWSPTRDIAGSPQRVSKCWRLHVACAFTHYGVGIELRGRPPPRKGLGVHASW